MGLPSPSTPRLGRLFVPVGGAAALLAALLAVLALAVVGVPWAQLRQGRRLPPIHDITTDVQNPPPFVAILPPRRSAANPAEYGGPAVAAQQRQAYPEIAPATFAEPPASVFRVVERVACQLGWQIVAVVPAEGRLEATARTFWFGFTDDVVVRLTPQDGGSRVDVRSTSRVGRGDLGTNAARVRRFLAALRTSGLSAVP